MASNTPESTQVCTACMDEVPVSEICNVDCQHSYCVDCTRYQFNLSVCNQQAFPPQCCGHPFEITLRLFKILGQELALKYAMKASESSVAHPVFCSNPECNTFILGTSFAGFPLCQKCGTITCPKCSKGAHEGECPLDKATEELVKLAKEMGWRRCYKCGDLIEKTVGCNRISCNCGAQFCYVCSAPFDDCKCQKPPNPAMHEGQAPEVEGNTAAAQTNDDTVPPRHGQESTVEASTASSTASSQTIDYTAPSPQGQESAVGAPTAASETKRTCHHHSRKAKLHSVQDCPNCGRTSLPYILKCSKCSLHSCWWCFRACRHRARIEARSNAGLLDRRTNDVGTPGRGNDGTGNQDNGNQG
ncbi:hypothetical protein GGR54DRAFT_649860 [Hypoxylon sp. NC1633]|nr:hypothetical protein GGR54DRAFT_649860 [Hypoxylon sp. NC1633]